MFVEKKAREIFGPTSKGKGTDLTTDEILPNAPRYHPGWVCPRGSERGVKLVANLLN